MQRKGPPVSSYAAFRGGAPFAERVGSDDQKTVGVHEFQGFQASSLTNSNAKENAEGSRTQHNKERLEDNKKRRGVEMVF